MKYLRPKLLTLGFVLALVASACGGSPEPAQTTQPAPDTTQTTQPATTTESEDHEEEAHEEEAHEEEAHETTTTAALSGDEDRVVEIVMTEFAFEPAEIHVEAGETIRFVVRNDGLVEHELRLSNAHRIEEHLASGHEDHDDGEGGHHEDGDVFVLVQPGETGELLATFPADTSVFTHIACLIPGHYEAGMEGPIHYDES